MYIKLDLHPRTLQLVGASSHASCGVDVQGSKMTFHGTNLLLLSLYLKQRYNWKVPSNSTFYYSSSSSASYPSLLPLLSLFFSFLFLFFKCSSSSSNCFHSFSTSNSSPPPLLISSTLPSLPSSILLSPFLFFPTLEVFMCDLG